MNKRNKKALSWVSFSVTAAMICFLGFWFYPLPFAILLILGWLVFMLYTDPPENWNL